MHRETDFVGGEQTVADLIQELLASARQRLDLEVAFVSEFVAGRRVFRCVDAREGVEVIRVGDSDPLDQTYCQRVADGQLPELIPNAAELPETQSLEITHRLSIVTYVSTPIHLSDGTVYGTFCSFSRRENPRLSERDLDFVRVFADITASLIQQQQEELTQARDIRSTIRALIDNDRLTVVCQPIVSLESGETLGYEALTRVHNSSTQWPPQMLFEEAARVGLEDSLAVRTLENALATLEELPDHTFVALNLSPAFILNHDMAELMGGQDLRRLVLEITEHAIIREGEYSAMAQALTPLRERGALLSVDDAGAGYASFRHILVLRPDIIKLDMSITRNINRDMQRTALTTALVEFAHHRGYRLIAEGIETQAEYETLRSLGVHMGQGFYIDRPQPVAVFKNP